MHTTSGHKRRLLSAGADGSICLWEVSSESSRSTTIHLLSRFDRAHSVYEVNAIAAFRRISAQSVQLDHDDDEDQDMDGAQGTAQTTATTTTTASTSKWDPYEATVFATAGDDGGISVWKVVD